MVVASFTRSGFRNHESVSNMDGAEEIVSRQIIEFRHPQEKIPVPHAVDAPMFGNGFTGIALSGKWEKQVYYIARNDFWYLHYQGTAPMEW